MRLFGQHEAAGARQRIESGLREAFKLHLAVAVGEVGEHEEGQPVRRFLIECAEHTRRFFGTRRAAQQIIRLFAPVLPEVFLQQVDHRPEVAPFLHVHLEKVPHVIKRRRGEAEEALLFDRARLRVALDNDQALQQVAVFARHFLPGLFTEMLAAGNDPVLDLRGQKDAPAVFRHLHIVELGPTLRVHRNGGAEVDHALLKLLRDQVVPPVDIAGVPFLQRLQHAAVGGKADIVRDERVVFDIHEVEHSDVLPVLNSGRVRRVPCCSRRAGRCRSAAGRRRGRPR